MSDGGYLLIFAGQQDDAVGEIQRDFLQREVREGERLGEYRVAVAVLSGEGGGTVGMHAKRPELERLGGHALIAALREGDVIE